jgi:methyl-accepting chemotaxis protein
MNNRQRLITAGVLGVALCLLIGAVAFLALRHVETAYVGLTATPADAGAAELAQRRFRDAVSTARSIVVGAAMFAALVFLAVWRVLANGIVRTLDFAIGISERIAAGDLAPLAGGASVTGNRRMIAGLDRMRERLREVVERVTGNSGFIAERAAVLAQDNAVLREHAVTQVASLEQTATSMARMTETVKEAADGAAEASRFAGTARDEAEAGGTVVRKAVQAMGEITMASEKITDIIATIDGIAFQTNLLALNAAVEAARAGEQGRGFAVVAAEVRALAQRSALAAKEIKALIDDSVQKIQAGSTHVSESGKILLGIVGTLSSVADIVRDIAAASADQSSGIEEVARAIQEIQATIRDNAALAEQAAASSQAMQEHAQAMLTEVGYFRSRNAVSSA